MGRRADAFGALVDFRDAADQDALLGRLYAQLVKWTGMSVRHALRLDHGPSDEEDHRPTLASMLRASHDSVPVLHGGTNDISNLQAECYECNFRKNAAP